MKEEDCQTFSYISEDIEQANNQLNSMKLRGKRLSMMC